MIDAISLIREMDDPFNIEISMIEEAVDFSEIIMIGIIRPEISSKEP